LGLYSLLQFHPDVDRAEGVNVGLVVFDIHGNEVAVVLTPTNARVYKLFDDEYRINGLLLEKEKLALRANLQALSPVTPEVIRACVRGQASSLIVTEPKAIVLVSNAWSEASQLFYTLVEPRKKSISSV
jgi:hypothetical protein